MKKQIKKIAGALLASAIISAGSTCALADSISVFIDEEPVTLTNANDEVVEPLIQNGTTYVPLRGISENLGCTVEWDALANAVKIYKDAIPDGNVIRNGDDEIRVYVDNELAELKDANGTKVEPFIVDGTTYVPVRGVSQALGCQVEWDGQAREVRVYKDIISPNGMTLSENKPYETNGVDTFYELDGRTLKIDDASYSNAIGAWGWSSFTLFNLDGKIDSVSFVAGSTDSFDEEKTIKFIVDGKIIETCTIPANSTAEEYSVDLNKGLQLKIALEGRSIGMGDIVFH